MEGNIEQALKDTTDYLYKVDGDITPEQYKAIGLLRQLINESFIGKKKLISSQVIYDILKDVL